jgi:rod shape-determining protein MreC
VRNIFLFIRRYFNFLFFLVLQIIALSFLFRYNKFHEAAFMGVANELTGRVSEKFSNVQYYFHLNQTNQSLAKQNEALLNQLKGNFPGTDSAQKVVSDTIRIDSTTSVRKFLWRSARVVNNTVTLPNNYMTISRGEKQGLRKDMGVVSPEGLVGTVINTSENFAVVMTMLNRQSSVSAKLKKTGDIGKVQWNGNSPYFVEMVNVPKNVQVAPGDSVVTSGYSLTFPEGIMVGVVHEVINSKTSNFFTLKLRPATNFFRVEYVNVVENLQREEQRKLEEATKRSQ